MKLKEGSRFLRGLWNQLSDSEKKIFTSEAAKICQGISAQAREQMAKDFREKILSAVPANLDFLNEIIIDEDDFSDDSTDANDADGIIDDYTDDVIGNIEKSMEVCELNDDLVSEISGNNQEDDISMYLADDFR